MQLPAPDFLFAVLAPRGSPCGGKKGPYLHFLSCPVGQSMWRDKRPLCAVHPWEALICSPVGQSTLCAVHPWEKDNTFFRHILPSFGMSDLLNIHNSFCLSNIPSLKIGLSIEDWSFVLPIKYSFIEDWIVYRRFIH